MIRENARTSKSEDIRKEVDEFGEDAWRGIRSLTSRLSHGTFKFPAAKGVPIPKRLADGRNSVNFRPIVISDIESRIVQRSILDVLLSIEGLKPYAENRYSFGGIRKGEDGLGAVPAAIDAVLNCIREGAKFVTVADISSFFTRISKDAVTQIVRTATQDDEFTDFFRKAINVELSNMAALKEKAEKFPTHDIGVAQGNSLSPLLGNIILHDFDRQMNEGDCRCLRYIDDFIILAPTERAANARLRKADMILQGLGMSFAPDKSFGGVKSISSSFEFLGIELSNGLIRPSPLAQERLIAKVKSELDASVENFRRLSSGQIVEKSRSLISTLKRVDGIVLGWGKHYRFCNDEQCFKNLDNKISNLMKEYLGIYSSIRRSADVLGGRVLFGIEQLACIDRTPFIWPK
ncbi:reverse transcriptase/maturase family protein [Niveispirillum sp. BGYR6]|uniref:reverse transcriptase/maturase family protein n=1 Tax=Niveispirillum sp. BGYR6 TaxID=2971249 RepID=UPI0022B9AB17|nr:reverse transcriptase/maturase family protein [Niveispirillum sp. BGYR6]